MNITQLQRTADYLKAAAAAHGQGHIFDYFHDLSVSDKTKLVSQVSAVEFDVIEKLVNDFIKGAVHSPTLDDLEPAEVIPIPVSEEQKKAYSDARAAGEEALRNGRVACFLVAGGQGTRLGFDGPKGEFIVGPVSDRTLFHIHAEKILALSRKYNVAIPWLIMTSDANDLETHAFFEVYDYFDLDKSTVRIFKQANMPAVGRDGRILMRLKSELALNPNGHGGSIKGLYDSGSCTWLRKQGVDTLFYFQVDNVLTRIGDPAFIGYHLLGGSQMSSKACRKRNWQERVGVFGMSGGKLRIVEYSDLPESRAKETLPDGSLKWWAGSIAIHVIDLEFIEQLNKGGFQLPYHKAEKSVPCLGDKGKTIRLMAGEKNGIKFETFVFDALTQADRTVIVETSREDDFSPVKNAAPAEDSLDTAKRDMMELYARWLAAAGTKIPRTAAGALDCEIEISPLASLEGENLEDKAPGEILPGVRFVI